MPKRRRDLFKNNPANTYLFKFNNRNTKMRCEICSKLTIKKSERRQWSRSGVFIVNFEDILHLILHYYCYYFQSQQLNVCQQRELLPSNFKTLSLFFLYNCNQLPLRYKSYLFQIHNLFPLFYCLYTCFIYMLIYVRSWSHFNKHHAYLRSVVC